MSDFLNLKLSPDEAKELRRALQKELLVPAIASDFGLIKSILEKLDQLMNSSKKKILARDIIFLGRDQIPTKEELDFIQEIFDDMRSGKITLKVAEESDSKNESE